MDPVVAVEGVSTSSGERCGVIPRDENDRAEAESWFRRAAEGGNVDVMFSLGVLLDERGDLAGAADGYQRATDLGDNDAKTNLANVHMRQNRI